MAAHSPTARHELFGHGAARRKAARHGRLEVATRGGTMGTLTSEEGSLSACGSKILYAVFSLLVGVLQS
ncbi:hypothetical protein HMPREF1868_01956 [Olsenella sp. DNF00959]|nr:hypothetical protein HMPREF1868_01956 [Olsenella sp. DNF00959]